MVTAQRLGLDAEDPAETMGKRGGLKPALSAWESDRSRPMNPLNSQLGRPVAAVIDRS